MLKLHELKPDLRKRILDQVRKEDSALGGLASNRPESNALQTLVRCVQKPTSGPQGVALRITLIAFRKRLLDQHDTVAYSFKPLTDAIAFTLGLDDADKRLRWEYLQVVTRGRTGVIVMIATV